MGRSIKVIISLDWVVFSKDGGCSQDVKSTIIRAQGVFSQFIKVWKNREIRILYNLIRTRKIEF